MTDYLTNIKKEIYKIIDELITKKILDEQFNKLSITIDYLSKSKQGDISSNFLILIKKNVIKNNLDILEFVESKLLNIKFISKITISKIGFVNFFLKDDYIFSNLKNVFKDPNKYGDSLLGENKKINVEFVSANPTGPIHIAHIRGAVLGDVLSKILESTGYKVTREYYVNDSGTQIEVLGNSLFKRYSQLNGEKIDILENEYPGEYLINIANKIYTNDKDKWLKIDFSKRKKYFETFAIKNIIESIKHDLNSININFDSFIYESDIIKSDIIDKFYNLLEKKNLLYEGILDKPKGDDNENWKPRNQLLFKSSEYDDEIDRPIKKENGESTYFANDAAYHYNKFLRNFDQLINIWGADHIGYINRMTSIVKAISDKSNFLDVRICQIVRLIKDNKILKMSKREGNFITLKDILKEVGRDSLRYYMISTKNETPIDFNLNKVIEKNKDNPVFYCQYAYARASSVINKSKSYDVFKNFENNFDKFSFNYLSIYEKEIILKIISWPYLLSLTSNSKQPHRITNFLENLSSDFHSFWNMGKNDETLRMLDLENINKTITKLIWIQSFRIVLKRAFFIIGIDAPENM